MTVPKESGDGTGNVNIVKNQKEYVLKVIEYSKERAKFDEILSAIGEYFELFKTHTELLEDLWLQLLGFLGLQNPQKLCVFRKIHYTSYIKLVVEHQFIKPIIEKAAEALQRNEGSEYLSAYLEKISEIKEGFKEKDRSYEDFLKGY